MFCKQIKSCNVPLQWQFSLFVVVSSYLIIVLVLLSLYLFNSSVTSIKQQLFADWYDQHVVSPVSRVLPLGDDNSHANLAHLMTQWIAQPKYIKDVGEVNIEGLALIDRSGAFIEQWGKLAFSKGDVTSQVPMFVRDDLADALLDHVNSGIETDGDIKWVVRPIYSSEQQVIAALLSVQRWQLEPSHWFNVVVWRFLPWREILLIAAIPIVFVVFIILLVSQLARKRLLREFSEFDIMLARWSKGQFEQRFDINKPIEIANSYKKLNQLAEQLKQYVELQNQQQLLQTRVELAVGLHDTVKQSLFANKMLLATALYQQKHQPSVDITPILLQAESTNQQAMVQISTLISNFSEHHHGAVEPDGFIEFLHALFSEVNVEIELHIAITQPVYHNVANVVRNVVSEALQNTYKHAKEKRAVITCQQANDGRTLSLIIQDFGTVEGLKVGQGIQLMQMQVEQLGGCFDLTTNQKLGLGMVINATLPNVLERDR